MKVSIRTNKLKKGNSYTVFIDYGIVNDSRKREPLETFSNKKDADNYKSKVQTEINNNSFIHVPDISFSEAIDEWMKNYVENNCEPNTAESYRGTNEKYLKPCLGHIPFKVISSPQGIDIINSYYHYLRFELENETIIDKRTRKEKHKKNLSYNSVDHHKAQISGILTYFMSCKKISNNICLNTVIPKTEEEKMKDVVIDDIENFEDDELYEDDEFITPEQAVQVINLFMNTDMMLPVCWAAFVGLRRSEIAGILKSKVDKSIRKVVIKTVRVRCGNKTIFKKKNKNKSSTRSLYFPSIMLKVIELDEKRQAQNKIRYGDEYIDSKFLCVKDNGEPLKVNYLSAHFKIVFEKFYNSEKEKAQRENREFNFPYITLHKLRHLNISSLLANGAYLTDVKSNAGHSDVNTTMIYTHNYTEGKKEIADKTDEIYKPLFKISC
ncbi:MAG: tyrosine-type recombinase/integrase [Clostridia bacterium]|nr:tyrosine-type recombinase/integrase [Clostridia bacterium]